MISVDGILLSRAVDPSELLMDLGFGGPEKSYISKIPSRFFGESSVSSIVIYCIIYIVYNMSCIYMHGVKQSVCILYNHSRMRMIN